MEPAEALRKFDLGAALERMHERIDEEAKVDELFEEKGDANENG